MNEKNEKFLDEIDDLEWDYLELREGNNKEQTEKESVFKTEKYGKERKDHSLLVAFIGATATIIAAFIGVNYGKSSEQKIIQNEFKEVLGDEVNIIGDGNEVTINDIKELVEDYQNIKEQKESLLVQNAKYFDDLDNANKEIEDLQAEIETFHINSERYEKIALAESYASSGNYEVAIQILNEVGEKTGDVNALLNDYTINYEVSIISDVEILVNNGEYNEAMMLLDEALKIVPDNEVLLDKKDKITPKYLVDAIECYKSENLWRLDSREYIKMSGKSYRHAIFSQVSDTVASMFNRAYSASAFYNLEGKYSKISGVVGHIDFSGSGTIGENDSGRVYDAEITIWGDDKEICTITLSASDVAKNFNESIEGVNILEFKVICNGNSKVGIAEIQISN